MILTDVFIMRCVHEQNHDEDSLNFHEGGKYRLAFHDEALDDECKSKQIRRLGKTH